MGNEIKDFKVNVGYQGYVFLGWAQGQFEPEKGGKRPYFNMFVFSPASSRTPESNHGGIHDRKVENANEVPSFD